MAFSPAGAQEVSLQVFGSWVPEMSPDALPEGVSPDNQEMVFVPGSAGARGALQRVFSTPFPAGGPNHFVPTAIYGKSFTTASGDIKNLYFDSNGSLWVEDFSNNPGSYSLLFQSTPGSFCRSVTAQNKEYFAISDGLHGADLPFLYDGVFLDRISQDGPGAPPSVVSVPLPSSTMAASGSAPSTTVTSAQPSDLTALGNPEYPVYYYLQLWINVASTSGISYGQQVTLSGSSVGILNTSYTVIGIQPNTVICSAVIPNGTGIGSGGSLTIGANSTLIRNNNSVLCTTTAAHGLKQGYLAQIQNAGTSAIGAGISAIVINNEQNPGIATVTTNSPHGLLPQNQVTIAGVAGVVVGTGISNVAFGGGIVTVTTSTPHGLTVGAEVLIAAVTATAINGQYGVLSVPSTTTFTFAWAGLVTDPTGANVLQGYSAADTGTVTYVWPIVTTGAAPNYFTVLTAPTPTTFTMAMNYTDGTWASGTIAFSWNGTFYVTSVPSATTFYYQQYGPNATTSTVGTVTPYGQMAPGIHLCRVSFLTRQGQQTRPSPWVQFEAAGGQYPSVSNIAIGPPNVVARIVEFTGAGGSYFYYIPVPAQVNGQVVSTATEINDNATTSAIFDFGDPTLFSALGTTAPTYNTAQQFTLDGALGFIFDEQRLMAFGQRNTVNNFLNMSFDGGYLPLASPQGPSGWATLDSNGALVGARLNQAWQVSVGNSSGTAYGGLTQSAYEDAFGAPILQPSTQYKIRLWLEPSLLAANGPSFQATLTSVLTGFSATASIANAVMNSSGSFLEAVFSAQTPITIPADLLLTVEALGNGATSTLTLDELFIIPTESPYTDTLLNASYLSTPEQFNGVTGVFGPPDDTHKIMDGALIRGTLYLLTQDPQGRLHQVIAGNTEPAGWIVREVASSCGLLSAFALTKSQADNRSSSGGEEWLAWASQSGPRIFGGSQPHKIGQEIQPAWYDPANNQIWPQINMAAALTAWALNDPVTRTIYFGVPLGLATAPSIVYPVNYRELDSAEAIAASPPFHPSYAGRLIATDNTRKWTRWNMTINGAALMYRSTGALSLVLFGGNGQSYGAVAGYGNCYTLNPAKYTDDDYGQMNPYYVTAFLPTVDQQQMLQLGAGRKQLAYFSAMISAIANVTITVLCDNLQNPWALTGARTPGTNPNYDLEWSGGSAQAQRMAFKISSSPIGAGTDNGFNLRKLTAWLRPARLRVRGKA